MKKMKKIDAPMDRIQRLLFPGWKGPVDYQSITEEIERLQDNELRLSDIEDTLFRVKILFDDMK